MYKRHDRTSIGGSEETFQTTCWTEIRSISHRNKLNNRQITEHLMKMYWKPVYCYLRRKGYANEPAKDLTQGFFYEIVLGSGLLEQANQAKGRFRNFLLTALERYITNVFRKETAQKRAPANGLLLSLDEDISAEMVAAPAEFGPEQIFHYAWASELVDTVLQQVKNECLANDKAIHWEIFNLRILSPLIDAAEPVSIPEICKKYGIQNQQKVSNMIVTVKRMFKSILEEKLRPLVQADSEIRDELDMLIRALSINGEA